MRRLIVLLALVAVAGATAAAGSPRSAATPRPHPRIWLDRGTLKTLRARAHASTAEWRKLKADCDSLLKGPIDYPDGDAYPTPGIGEGYQGDGYFPAVLDLGLCAQTAPSGRATYAKRVAGVLAAMSNPSHEPNPLRDDGYGIRFYVTTMAIGFDWAYSSLSSHLKSQVITAIHHWISAFESGGFERDFPQGNYYAGYFEAKALAALATMGDDSAANGEWSSWLHKTTTFVEPYYKKNLAGGGWPEGWEYGQLGTMDMTWPFDAARTALGAKLVKGFPYALAAPRFILYFTWPNLRSLEDSGVQHDNINPSPADPWLGTAEAGMLARFGSTFAPYMHDYAKRVRAANPKLVKSPSWGAWVDFLYWNPKAKNTSVKRLPRSYFARGMGMAAMRSTWSKTAVWAMYKAAPYNGNPDAGEEFYDEGSLEILNGSHQFLVYAPSALMRNTPGTNDGDPYETLIYNDLFDGKQPRDLFNVFMTSRPTPTGQGDQSRADGAKTKTTFTDHGAYAVARSVHLEDMYPQRAGDKRAITRWSRDVVYVRPNLFIVHDRTSVTKPVPDEWLGWSFLGRPRAAGAGRYRLPAGTVQAVLPAGNVEEVVNVFGSNKVYRVEVRRRPRGYARVDHRLPGRPRHIARSAGAGARRIRGPRREGHGSLQAHRDLRTKVVKRTSTFRPRGLEFRSWVGQLLYSLRSSWAARSSRLRSRARRRRRCST